MRSCAQTVSDTMDLCLAKKNGRDYVSAELVSSNAYAFIRMDLSS